MEKKGKVGPRGIVTALVTPLNSDGSLRADALAQLVDLQQQAGVHGLFVLGTYGEGPYITPEVKKQVVDVLAERSKRPIILHVGAAYLRDTLDLVKRANEYDNMVAVSSVGPFYFRPDTQALIRFYGEIAKVSRKPIFVYNNPGRQGYNIEPATFGKIVREVPQVVGVKDTSYNMEQVQELVQQYAQEYTVYGAGDSLIFLQLTLGVTGHICGISNLFPELAVKLYDAFSLRRYEEARALQFELNEIRKVIREPGVDIAPLKMALNLRGIDAGVPAAPLRPLTDEEEELLVSKLKTVADKYLKP